MKILYIDPWCVDGSNLYYYSTGLVGAMSKHSDVTLICQKNCHINSDAYDYRNVFFPHSTKMMTGKCRLIIRGFEYIVGYLKILKYAKKEKYDIIHIEWPLLYKADVLFLKTLKKHCRLLSLKAHNVLPHSTGMKYVDVFRKIYNIPDIILVHGDSIKKIFCSVFPEYESKVQIQKLGADLKHNCLYSEVDIDKKIMQMLQRYNRMYLFCGRIDYDKGVDRLVSIWSSEFSESNSMLVVAGKIDTGYDFSDTKRIIDEVSNILFVPGYIDDNLFNFLVDKCCAVLLPYRNGSMSGVAITAAEFSKPLVSTDFGSINEYVINGENGIITENDDKAFMMALQNIETKTEDELAFMGQKYKTFFYDNFDWNQIGDYLINHTYKNALEIEQSKFF